MATNRAPFSAESFDFGPPRPLRPVADEPDEFLRRYYELERSEHFATQQAISLHRPDVVTWFRILNYYHTALDVPSISTDDMLWLTFWKILRLGISASKSALDATLAGYYVSAFAAIRQMAEYWFGLQHLELNPASVAGFYAAPEGVTQVRLPYMGARIREAVDAFADGGGHADANKGWWAQLVHKTYRRMSEGHHLDGLAIVQTGNLDDAGYYLGATYHESLAREALCHGTLMTGALAFAAALVMAPFIEDSEGLVDAINSAFGDALGEQTEED